jgi:predicted restriction endonuclease
VRPIEVVQLFAGIRPARQGGGYAPHKPLVLLLLFEAIINGHENRFLYDELDHQLRVLLEKYGSPSASTARNEPFWRLQNDGVLHLTAPISLLQLASTPTTTQLIEGHAFASFDPDVYAALRGSRDLVRETAERIAELYLDPTQSRAIIADAAPSIARLRRRFWWVSQNKTYREEIDGNFMWSPRTSADGNRNPNYDFMREMTAGDVVFSYSGTMIRAIGVVISQAEPCPKPADFGGRGISWLDDGWLVGVAFRELGPAAVRPSEHMDLLRNTLPARYAPIRPNGHGNQIYLAPVPHAMAEVLTGLIGLPARAIIDDVTVIAAPAVSLQDAEAADALKKRTDIGATQKIQLVMARRGQGIFRANVGRIEQHCRVTMTSDRIHLVASHIKPWSKSNDEEKLSGYNGLLLSPHIDHLFDRGYLSFEDSGELLVSRKLDPEVLEQWHVDGSTNVGAFNKEQRPFLEYHRDVVLVH